MDALLLTLRRNTQPTPEAFLRTQPGCFIQYYDDTPAKDPAKALSAATFDPEATTRKQAEGCAVCFSLQAFKGARTKECLVAYRNLGVDIDLVPAPERAGITDAEVDRRKGEYLTRHLRPFALRPHWLIETGHGFHVVFRVPPVSDPARVAAAEALNRRLVAALRGDPNAALLTQCLRVPGTYQFKDPARPFLCRLLLDSSAVLPPHDPARVRVLLDAWEVYHEPAGRRQGTGAAGRDDTPKSGWREVLGGVPEGQRNAAAAALVGGILCRLPEELWDTAGWGGLRVWNDRNEVPLRDAELRAVFQSIARREREKRREAGDGHVSPRRSFRPVQTSDAPPGPQPDSPPPHHAE